MDNEIKMIFLILSTSFLFSVIFIFYKVGLPMLKRLKEIKILQEDTIFSSPYSDPDDDKFYKEVYYKALNELNGKDDIKEKYSTNVLNNIKPKRKFYSTIFDNKKVILSQEEIYISNGISFELSKILCEIFPNFERTNYITTLNDGIKYEIRFHNIVDSYPFVIQRMIYSNIFKNYHHSTDTYIFLNNSIAYYMEGSPNLFANDISNMITKSKQIEPRWCVNYLKEKYEKDNRMNLNYYNEHFTQPVTKNFSKD